MWAKRCVSLLLAAALALSLAGCGANGDKDKNKGGAMTIAPAQLSEEEQAVADLLALGMESYHIFDFQVEGAKSIHLRAYELSDGEWNCAEHGVLEAAGGAGRVALTFGKMTEGVRMACKDAAGIFSSEVTMAAGDDAASMTFATSTLTESAKIELDQEIPLAVQIATTKNEIRSYEVGYFHMPREYAKHGYEHVYAITVTFSASAPSEPLADVSAAPSSEPSPAN